MKSIVFAIVFQCLALGLGPTSVETTGLLPEYYNLRGGTFYGSFSSPLYYQYRYGYPRVHSTATVVSYTPKAIPAQLPVSKPFDIEIMKPASQLPNQKTVPLYIVPQSSLHVFPHVQKYPAQPTTTTANPIFQRYQFIQFMNDPSHLPAIEIPLQEPMVVGTVSTDVVAPSGFNVVLRGPFGNTVPFPIYTAALLAPVPVGTIVSKETPVILTTIYAIPSLPYEPSYYPILAQFPSKMIGPSKGSKLAQSVKNTFVSTTTGGSIISPSTPLPVVPVSREPQQTFISYPEPSFPTAVPAPPTSIFHDQELELEPVSPAGIISGTAPEFTPRPFINSKESPYLQELREQSIRSQIAELQQLLHTLTATRTQIGNNYTKK